MDYKTIETLVKIWIKNEFPQVNIDCNMYDSISSKIILYPNMFDDLVISIPNKNSHNKYFVIFSAPKITYTDVGAQVLSTTYIEMLSIHNPKCNLDELLKPIKDYLLSDANPLPILDSPSPVNNPIAK